MSLKDSVFVEDIAQGKHGKDAVLRYLDVCPDLWDKVYSRKAQLEKELLRAQLWSGENPINPSGESAAHYAFDDEINRLGAALQWIDEATQPQQPRKRGRKQQQLYDLMNGEDEERKRNIALLHTLMDGKTDRDCAMIVTAAINAGIMQKPTFSEINKEFTQCHLNKSGFCKYLNSTGGAAPFTDNELTPIVAKFKQKSE